jgi:hypothetical protein
MAITRHDVTSNMPNWHRNAAGFHATCCLLLKYKQRQVLQPTAGMDASIHQQTL